MKAQDSVIIWGDAGMRLGPSGRRRWTTPGPGAVVKPIGGFQRTQGKLA